MKHVFSTCSAYRGTEEPTWYNKNTLRVYFKESRTFFMSDQASRCFGNSGCRHSSPSPSDAPWEIILIQRNKQPYQGMWALPGGHLNTDDASLEAAAQCEVREETGITIPLHLFQQVHTFEDFEDPRGKYLCLLYVLSEPLGSDVTIEAGDDAARVQWYSVKDLQLRTATFISPCRAKKHLT